MARIPPQVWFRSCSAWVPAFVWIVGCALLVGCGHEPVVDSGGEPSLDGLSADRSADLGVTFVHESGRAGMYYMPEIMGSGVALFDADGDEDLDLYLVQGGAVDAETEAGDRLFLNRLAETGTLTFEDTTESAGLLAREYGMGVAVADIDADGDSDLFVTNYGPNQLWRNDGAGNFERLPGPWESESVWSVSAAFADIDGDRQLDLFVTNYLDFNLTTHRICPTSRGEDDYCGPVSYRPLADRLYRNLGAGRFDDVSVGSGVGVPDGSGLGVVATDIDVDGRVDLFVANDKMPNFLWHNEGEGRFTEVAGIWGTGVNHEGESEAGMGVDAADVDGDGDEDLVLAHLAGETHTLYRNEGGYFTDATIASGIAGPSLPINGFGVVFADLDLDGWLDVVVTGGHVHRLPELVEVGDPFPYHQPSQWLRNRGAGVFEDVTARLGGDLNRSRVARGLAVGDLDDDGDLDVVVTAMDERPAILLNGLDPGDAWLGLRVVEPWGADAIGARVRLVTPDGRELWRRITTGGSYGSARDPRVLLPLAAGTTAEVEVHGLDGSVERFTGLEAGRYHRLERGGSP